jgi:2-octaprenyl-6-methoxyphenol hydroxylase
MLFAEIIIVGAGYSGLSLSLMLARHGIKSVVVEKSSFAAKENNKPYKKKPCRLFALAAATCELYAKYGINLAFSEIGQPINYIRVLDHGSPAILDFCPQDLELESFGFMVEERLLRQELLKQVRAEKNITLIDNSTIKEISYENGFIYINNENDGQIVRGNLLVAADGKHSRIRQLAGIDVFRHDYRQIGIVCDVVHEKSHAGVAVERFLPDGPFALLPKHGEFSSSIVWTDSDEKANALKSLNSDELNDVIALRFGNHLGEVKVVSSVEIFPLELCHANKYYAKKIALVGDAAHAIHPVAGQGFNLGLRDVDLLTQLIIKQKELGLDISSEIMLHNYQKARRVDNNLLIESTNLLNSIFASRLLSVKLARRLGMDIINHLPWIKKPIMKYASGYSDI